MVPEEHGKLATGQREKCTSFDSEMKAVCAGFEGTSGIVARCKGEQDLMAIK